MRQPSLKLLFLVLLLVKLAAQNDFNFTLERVEVVANDDKWLIMSARNFKYNRTNAAVNITYNMLKDFGFDFKFVIQGYKFASNEYRLFPVYFKLNVCEAIEKNQFGFKNRLKCGNLTRCPMKRGRYEMCNWAPDESELPPHCPSGRYMTDIKVEHASRTISNFKVYYKIEKRFWF